MVHDEFWKIGSLFASGSFRESVTADQRTTEDGHTDYNRVLDSKVKEEWLRSTD